MWLWSRLSAYFCFHFHPNSTYILLTGAANLQVSCMITEIQSTSRLEAKRTVNKSQSFYHAFSKTSYDVSQTQFIQATFQPFLSYQHFHVQKHQSPSVPNQSPYLHCAFSLSLSAAVWCVDSQQSSFNKPSSVCLFLASPLIEADLPKPTLLPTSSGFLSCSS